MSYQYDALDRLVSAQGVAQARPGVVDRFTSSFAYNDIRPHSSLGYLTPMEYINQLRGVA